MRSLVFEKSVTVSLSLPVTQLLVKVIPMGLRVSGVPRMQLKRARA